MLRLLAWSFVFIIMAWDIAFTWHYRTEVAVWECNPIARCLYTAFGVETMIGWRIVSTCYAAVVGNIKVRLAKVLTAIAVAAHAFLFVKLLIGW
jgi:hypothetical protein